MLMQCHLGAMRSGTPAVGRPRFSAGGRGHASVQERSLPRDAAHQQMGAGINIYKLLANQSAGRVGFGCAAVLRNVPLLRIWWFSFLAVMQGTARMHRCACTNSRRNLGVRVTHPCTPSGRRTKSQLFTFPSGSGMKGCVSSWRHSPSTMNLYWWYLHPPGLEIDRIHGTLPPLACPP